ncbi:hypothetical protein [Nocardioides sp. GXQ0305]|uniref:hypothetical protein n=1 Tax=Nocardioides sp. GXQ0305 TaxID=3423912 RepID=UPI003D7E00D7
MTRRLVTHASRRGLLGGALVGLTAAAGCEVDPAADEPTDPTPGPDAAESASAEDPDAELVRRVVDDLGGALALVTGVARARRPLAAEVAPWRVQHAAHLEALEAPARAQPLRVRGTVPELQAQVRRREAALQRSLAGAAVSARSGPLAALLGSMAAAVAQQLAADAEGRDR